MNAKSETQPQMRFERVQFSPSIAAEWLTRIPAQQRSRRPSTVRRYASDMKAGKWAEDSPEAIAVGVDGTILNGQHRLAAIVESGVTLTMWCAFNVPMSVYHVFDMGFRRTPGDTAKALGIKFDSIDLAMARTAFVGSAGGGASVTTMSQLFVLDIATALRGHISAIRAALGNTRLAAPITGAGVNAMYRSSTADRVKIARFFEVMSNMTPSNAEETAATRFAKWVATTPIAKEYGSAGRVSMFKVTQRAIRAYLDGVELSKYYVPTGDVFAPITTKDIDAEIAAIKG